jgi:hypothetical protein
MKVFFHGEQDEKEEINDVVWWDVILSEEGRRWKISRKLAYARLKQLGLGDLRLSMLSDLVTSKSPKDRTTRNNFHLLRKKMVMTKGMQESQSHVDTPF